MMIDNLVALGAMVTLRKHCQANIHDCAKCIFADDGQSTCQLVDGEPSTWNMESAAAKAAVLTKEEQHLMDLTEKAKTFSRKHCTPLDCFKCEINPVCKKKLQFGTTEICPQCGKSFEVLQLVDLHPIHVCDIRITEDLKNLAKTFHNAYCEPTDCEQCQIGRVCKKRKLFGTTEKCTDCGKTFTIDRLVHMSPMHDCRSYHGW